MKFSIIIPVKAINDYVKETVPYIQNLTVDTWELIIIPNNPEPNQWQQDKRITIFPSGRVGPADKRDLGAKQAKGDVLVFLDDDSYPEPDILDIATKYFQDQEVIALGGPAITPPQDNFWQRVSGAVFLSKLSGGTPERYIPVGKVREIDDWPSVNLMIRISEFEKVGGFDCKFWPGEDTKLCLNLKKLGKKMLYIPTMIVWHHRREGLFAHLKQVGAYGLHRGYFAKNYPETSFKLKYFIPSIFSFFVIFSLLIQVIFNEYWNIVLSIGWMIYGFAVLIAILQIMRFEGVFVALISFPYILLTHFWYGIKFIYGFVHSDTLVSKLR